VIKLHTHLTQVCRAKYAAGHGQIRQRQILQFCICQCPFLRLPPVILQQNIRTDLQVSATTRLLQRFDALVILQLLTQGKWNHKHACYQANKMPNVKHYRIINH